MKRKEIRKEKEKKEKKRDTHTRIGPNLLESAH
jgi:hypothetical protein